MNEINATRELTFYKAKNRKIETILRPSLVKRVQKNLLKTFSTTHRVLKNTAGKQKNIYALPKIIITFNNSHGTCNDCCTIWA